jgi:hypothetical protein
MSEQNRTQQDEVLSSEDLETVAGGMALDTGTILPEICPPPVVGPWYPDPGTEAVV